ncbi:MAG: efflux RND transporter periplasmic adaptor subunit [Planctomycetota bacterium]
MRKAAALSLFVFVCAAGGGALGYLQRRSQPALPAGACAAHGVPAARCPWCDPGLIESLGTCGEHAVPEALCSRCTPALIPGFEAAHDWCREHTLPESQCVLCHPELAGAPEPPPPGAVDLLRAALPRSNRPPSAACDTEALQVRFASAEIARDAGLAYAQVEEVQVPLTLRCTAELEHDQNAYAHVVPLAGGVIEAVLQDLGARVQAGDPLARIASPELGAAKADLLQAQSLVALQERIAERERRLSDEALSTRREALFAEAELQRSQVAVSRATQRLLGLGLSAAEVAAVASTQDTSSSLTLRAPLSGSVVARHAVRGEVVDASQALFAVADTAQVWAMLALPEDEAHRVQRGQPVALALGALPGETFAGRVTWVSPELDRRTRTVAARAEVPNPDGRLRAGMFGEATVHVSPRAPRTVVPKVAVQWEGCCNVVFVRHSDRLFAPRKVLLGADLGQRWVVDAGLEPGETVVTTGSFLLKTEILKGSIGAGCCDVEPGR